MEYSYATIVNKRSQHLKIFQIRARIVVGCLKYERRLGQPGMLGHATQRLGPDVALADVPMSIDPRIVRRTGVIEMNGANVLCPHRGFDSANQRFQTVVLANVVAGGEGMSSIETDTKRKLWAKIHNLAQVLETMPDTLALARCVLQENSQFAQTQTTTCDLDARRAGANTIRFTSAARAARMNNQIIHAQQNRALNLFAKRRARLLQHQVIRGREVYQIVAMDNDGTEFRRASYFLEESDVSGDERFGGPATWITREDLHCVAADFFRDDERLVQAALDWSVETDATIVRFSH